MCGVKEVAAVVAAPIVGGAGVVGGLIAEKQVQNIENKMKRAEDAFGRTVLDPTAGQSVDRNPTPPPTPVVSDPTPTVSAAQKLKRLRAMRMGLMSTIKGGSFAGPASPAPLVSTPGLYATGTKTKLGE